MPTVTYVDPDGTKREVEVASGKRVMQAAIAAGIDGIVAECGGQAMCATCHVYVEGPWAQKFPPVSEEEDEMLEDTVSPRTESSRLSCQLVVTGEVDGLIVRLPEAQI
ncbi:ferredoxin [Rhodococcus pyridinivorans KG-16]|uniref:Ferredoxin n=1 Tax=Rhodococcus pyridinivorans KG-16 TaxID=1441730 RepID=A0A0V9UF01_9NOCA|nr:2Fe-2S iron-sulfur cluster-binding protein [Rhodococcus pyridinivorans]KSZ56609.1 ferredoxin [Rhodococcus pyridinivorans KG-16]